MKIGIALIVLCGSGGVAAAQDRQLATRAPLFTPRFVPNAAPTPSWYQKQAVPTARQRHAPKKSAHDFPPQKPETEVICGMTVVKKSPDADPGIFAQPKHSGESAIRRIKPPLCNPHR